QGGAAAAGAALASLVAVEVIAVLAWAVDRHGASSAAQATRIGIAIWLTGLHARVHVGAAVVGIAPLGLTLLIGVLIARAAAAVTRNRAADRTAVTFAPIELMRVTLAVAVPFGVICAFAAGLSATPKLHPSTPTALLGGLVLGGISAAWGARRALGPLDADLPDGLRSSVRAGGVALLALTAVSAATAMLAFANHGPQIVHVQRALAAGIVGGVALTVLQLTLVPNIVVAALSWWVGPGFVVGSGSTVSPSHVRVGQLPALPMLAALPGPHPPGLIVVAVPVLCGAIAGMVARRGAVSLLGTCGRALGAGACAGLLAGLLAAAAGGPAGPGRMLTVGPCAWQVGLLLAAEIAGGALLTVLAAAFVNREPLRR
ncbi:MAG TPA: DUF6350 family protein, partial [Mycobacteriales bacterium]|nr:DUF6350 family protein [Mycobacteriales bacterium]